jgi:hypothetical protein
MTRAVEPVVPWSSARMEGMGGGQAWVVST